LRVVVAPKNRKENTEHMRQEDGNPVVPLESQGMPTEENQEVPDEVYIPDYVMLDFGNPEATATYIGRYR
jgi:hypothetical protein